MLALILLALSAMFATLPMCLLLALVWWMDRYEREPIALLVASFIWGATGAILFSLVSGAVVTEVLQQLFLPDLNSSDLGFAVRTAFIAPLTEEPSKALIFAPLLFTRQFDNMTDGFVYGAAVGLGFGMVENFLYFAGTLDDVGTWVLTVIIRTLFSATGHAVFTSVVGASLGLAAFRGPGWVLFSLIVGMSCAIGMHGIWNGMLNLTAIYDEPGFSAAGFLLAILEFTVAFVIFEVCIFNEGRTVRRELTEEAKEGLIPLEHARILGQWWGRQSKRWLAPHVPHHRYVEATTLLAVRRRQVRLLGPRARPRDVQEVDVLRTAIRAMLKEP